MAWASAVLAWACSWSTAMWSGARWLEGCIAYPPGAASIWLLVVAFLVGSWQGQPKRTTPRGH
eukprot:2506180-Prorocentrum_lima.AAC.1